MGTLKAKRLFLVDETLEIAVSKLDTFLAEDFLFFKTDLPREQINILFYTIPRRCQKIGTYAGFMFQPPIRLIRTQLIFLGIPIIFR